VARIAAYVLSVAALGFVAQSLIGGRLHDAIWEPATPASEELQQATVTETETVRGPTRTAPGRVRSVPGPVVTRAGARTIGPGPTETVTVTGPPVTVSRPTVRGGTETVVEKTTVPGPTVTETVSGPTVTVQAATVTETVAGATAPPPACQPPPHPPDPPCPPGHNKAP
jgi:hypothetical protein